MALILIVDDNVNVLAPLSQLLSRLGHRGECASGGEEALNFVKLHRPDLIILDVMMPGMDGMEVLRHLRADSRLDGVPIVMFSAVADPDYRTHALNKGAADYWVKASVNFDELQSRFERLLPVAHP